MYIFTSGDAHTCYSMWDKTFFFALEKRETRLYETQY